MEEAEARVARLERAAVSLPAQVLPLSPEQVLRYVQDLPGLVAVDQDRAKALLYRFLASVVLNPTDDWMEAAFQINVAGVLNLVGEGTGVRYNSLGAGRAFLALSNSVTVRVGPRPPQPLRDARRARAQRSAGTSL